MNMAKGMDVNKIKGKTQTAVMANIKDYTPVLLLPPSLACHYSASFLWEI